MHDVDLLVIGGGINGAGIARDASGRGLRVLLCEQHDLAAHTSSASSKLIHGGLRYLEQREFGLVRKALGEREVVRRQAPYLVRPLRFVLPWEPHLRPRWMLRVGLWLYDHLGPRSPAFPASRVQGWDIWGGVGVIYAGLPRTKQDYRSPLSETHCARRNHSPARSKAASSARI